MQALVRSPAYVRVHRVGARFTRPLRQSGDLVAIVRCDLTRPIPAAKARVPLETFVASREEVLGELTHLRQSTDPAEQERLARALFTRRLEAVTNRQSPKAHRRLGWERTGTMLLAGRASGIRVVRLSGSTHPWRRLRPEDY